MGGLCRLLLWLLEWVKVAVFRPCVRGSFVFAQASMLTHPSSPLAYPTNPENKQTQVLIKAMPLTAFRLYSAVIRALNNAVGGISFVIIARMFGVQKAAAPADAAPAKGKKGGAAAKGKKPLLAKA
jgi:hypothetical protein